MLFLRAVNFQISQHSASLDAPCGYNDRIFYMLPNVEFDASFYLCSDFFHALITLFAAVQNRPVISLRKKHIPVRRKAKAASQALTLKPNLQLALVENSLAASLWAASEVLVQCQLGKSLPSTLSLYCSHHAFSADQRGALQDIVYRTVRQLGICDALIVVMTRISPQPALHAFLCCSLAQILDDGKVKPYADHTLVDQAVRAVSAHPEFTYARGLVNAILRRFLRESNALLQLVKNEPRALWNYPNWWIASIQKAYPKDWQSILKLGNQAPPLTLRVNLRMNSRDEYLKMLTTAGIDTQVLGLQALQIMKPMPVKQIPGFFEGRASVQDEAAQRAAPLLDVQNGMRVLDACAAPGGKTGHLLELADLDLYALDCDQERLLRVLENLNRLNLSAKLLHGDARQSNWWDGLPFDRILVDVPCTASGIVRRHPDIRWLRRPTDTEQLAKLSREILNNLWKMLAPGGKLLLVTCSVWPEESELQAHWFAQQNGVKRISAPGQLLPLTQAGCNHDGLFFALFQKVTKEHVSRECIYGD